MPCHAKISTKDTVNVWAFCAPLFDESNVRHYDMMDIVRQAMRRYITHTLLTNNAIPDFNMGHCPTDSNEAAEISDGDDDTESGSDHDDVPYSERFLDTETWDLGTLRSNIAEYYISHITN
jgi:hypothetical protein